MATPSNHIHMHQIIIKYYGVVGFPVPLTPAKRRHRATRVQRSPPPPPLTSQHSLAVHTVAELQYTVSGLPLATCVPRLHPGDGGWLAHVACKHGAASGQATGSISKILEFIWNYLKTNGCVWHA